MKGILSLLTAVIFALWLSGASSSPGKNTEEPPEVNLIINGSFEEGPDPDKNSNHFLWFNEGATDLKGWTVTRGQLSYVGTYWQHADGKRSLDMHGGPGFGGIKQSFGTRKGQKYRVVFSLAGNPEGTVPLKKLGIKAANQEEQFVFDCTDKNRTDMGWATQAWDFIAKDRKTTLELFTLMTEDGNCGPALDNVSVVEVHD
jgi:choice-of-anchor C domain-containing protein